jgi:surface antigen
LHLHQQVWKYFQQHNFSNLVVKISVAAVLALAFMGATFGVNVTHAHAQSVCASSDQTYSVAYGDTLAGIAARYGTTYQNLAAYNHIPNPNLIYVNQVICIPGSSTWLSAPNSPVQSSPASGPNYNVFPYPWCTWWANERYHEVHGIYVPWTTNADAWQWTARAYDFGWQVSSTPSVGSIIDLQPWVEGAYGSGHVAFVEQVLSNGDVIASTSAWGANFYQVTYVEFSPGPGVTFISQ